MEYTNTKEKRELINKYLDIFEKILPTINKNSPHKNDIITFIETINGMMTQLVRYDKDFKNGKYSYSPIAQQVLNELITISLRIVNKEELDGTATQDIILQLNELNKHQFLERYDTHNNPLQLLSEYKNSSNFIKAHVSSLNRMFNSGQINEQMYDFKYKELFDRVVFKELFQTLGLATPLGNIFKKYLDYLKKDCDLTIYKDKLNDVSSNYAKILVELNMLIKQLNPESKSNIYTKLNSLNRTNNSAYVDNLRALIPTVKRQLEIQQNGVNHAIKSTYIGGRRRTYRKRRTHRKRKTHRK